MSERKINISVFRYAFVLFACLVLCCCGENKTGEDIVETPSLSFDAADKHFSEKPVEFVINIDANCEWSFSINADWLYVVEPKSIYSGPQELTIDVKKNSTTIERTATIVFTYPEGQSSLKIIQSGYKVYLNISENNLSFGYRTAEKVITISSNCGWYAKPTEDWVNITPSTGLVGSFDIVINVEGNNTSHDRSATISVWNDEYGLNDTITITQNGQENPNTSSYIDEYGIDHGQGIIIRGLSWAPVNVGYKEDIYPLGKMFQWGRNNGLSYQDEVFNNEPENNYSPLWEGENGLERTSTFYKYGEGSAYAYDWIKNGDDSFWNKGTEENPEKNTLYDPCPEGWRIPTAFEFRSLIDFRERKWVEKDGCFGYEFYTGEDSDSKTIFFPAVGRLNTSDGNGYDRNAEGYYWTITGQTGNSAYFYFHSQSCSVNYQGSRAGGCALRCIKE